VTRGHRFDLKSTVKLLVCLLLSSLALVANAANLLCNFPYDPLKLPASRTGAYVRADIWKAFPIVKDRDALEPWLSKGMVLSMSVDKDGGFISGANGWHEGGGEVCPVFQGNQAWAVYRSENGKKLIREGPFVKVSDAPSIEEPIFHQIFGNTCLIDTKNREWCFDKQGIVFDKRRLASQLNLDNSESAVPGFEVTVSVAKDRSKADYFLGFVRTQTGWIVYRLSRAEFDASNQRPVWSSDKMPKPWETLTRLPN
jgi:hypothetical protein